MQFSCGQCGTRYAVPDDKVRGKRIRTKCRKCGTEIVVDGTKLGGDALAPPSRAEPSPRPAAEQAATGPVLRPTPYEGTASPARIDEPWTVAISRTDQRKMVTAEVVEAYAAGTITDSTLVWKHGMQKWQPPFDIPAIALQLLARGLEPKPKSPDQRAKTEPPPAAAPAASSASDWDDEATRVFDAAVVAEGLAAPKAPSLAPKSAASEWDDEDEATKMFAPDRGLLGRRLPKAARAPTPAAKLPEAPKSAPVATTHKTTAPKSAPEAPKPAPGSLRSRPPPVPPRRSGAPSKPPAGRSVPPPPPAPSRGPLTPSLTKDVGDEAAGKVPTVRPPPGMEMEDPFGFEDEATAVITAERARALLEEQLDKPKTLPPLGETPLAFGTDAASSQTADAAPRAGVAETGAPRTTRESVRSFDDLVEKGPTIVVAESERTSSIPPPPPPSALPAPSPQPRPPSSPPSSRDFGGIQHERTRVIRARKKPGGPLFFVALTLALGAAAVAGYYASRLLESTRTPLERR